MNCPQNNKTTRVNISSFLLHKCKAGGFWDSILTSDETWIYFDNKTQKKQWLSPGQAPRTTPKPDIHGKKIMLCCWWNSRGLVYYELVNPMHNIDADLYSKQLMRVSDSLKKLGINQSKVRFLQDNAKPHTAKVTHKKLDELGWKLLPHAPYSPDLAPSDYHLFRSLKQFLY
mgnify:CR=1 FL=1